MHTGRMTSLSLAPSHNDTTCYSLCSIRPADRPTDRPTDRPADTPEIGRSEVFIQWNFLDKSRVNNVMFRVLDDSEHSKLWTNVNRFSQRTLQLYNRIIQIKFNLSNLKSIKRILISVESDGDLIMRCCDPHKTRTCGQDMTVGTTVWSTDSKRSTLSSTVQPHTLPADGSESSVPTDGLKANVGAVVAVVTVAAVAFSSALFIFVFKRHRRLKLCSK
ncbi:uncharacterized protein LOC112567125 isoform X1 [Pomacea canaliculata]|uniref:uncharacterized protein LOC112567125 isoform X1 n=1 Tax=Pomacea canaliculata TaxID=400727 RepID=UPI000D738F65|nr:uncharacterized protein LOC112567125 isoform X1 [Pomacea canaliculata]